MAGGGGPEDRSKAQLIKANLGHELGLMFGFIALFAIVLALFSTFWISKNKRQAHLEHERQEDLKSRGFGLSGWENAQGEKKRMVGAGGGADEHVEYVDLDGHGQGYRENVENERRSQGNGIVGNQTGEQRDGPVAKMVNAVGVSDGGLDKQRHDISGMDGQRSGGNGVVREKGSLEELR